MHPALHFQLGTRSESHRDPISPSFIRDQIIEYLAKLGMPRNRGQIQCDKGWQTADFPSAYWGSCKWSSPKTSGDFSGDIRGNIIESDTGAICLDTLVSHSPFIDLHSSATSSSQAASAVGLEDSVMQAGFGAPSERMDKTDVKELARGAVRFGQVEDKFALVAQD